ncbi:unnamed protein product, partial [Didymodactylos carnosus]
MLNTYSSIGSLYCKLKRYEQARQQYEKKLQFINNDDQNGIGLCYIQMGWCYMREKSTDQALDYYLKSSKLCSESSTLLDAYLGLCDCYFSKKDFDQALVYYNKAIEYTEDKEVARKINLFMGKSECYQHKLDYEQALEEYKTCLKLIILNDDNKQQQSIVKVLLNSNKSNNDDDTNDIVYYTDLIDDNQIENDQLATIYNDIGFCYYKLNFYLLSLKYYKKSLYLYSTATTMTEQQQKLNCKLLSIISSLYSILSNNKMALDYAFKYLRILEAIELRQNQEQIELANCYNNIGWYYYSDDEHKLALDYCQEAIDLYQQLTLETVDEQQNYANAWSSLAVIYYDLDQISECFDCCQKSMKIFYKTSTTSHGAVGFNYELYANLHLKNGQRWVAEEFYRKALNIIKTHAPFELQAITRIENNYEVHFSFRLCLKTSLVGILISLAVEPCQ